MKVINASSTNNTTNFKAIKNVKCKGLYKEFPKYGKELVDSFNSNSKAIEFCKKYDVNLIFNACIDAMNSVKSSMQIIFKNPTKNKFLGFLGNQKDKIELTSYGNTHFVEGSLKDSTNRLVKYMQGTGASEEATCGVLESHLNLKENEIQKKLFKNSTNVKEKLPHEKNDTLYKWDKEDLEDSINNLINNSK